MPIYEYDCYSCGSRSETLRSSQEINQTFQCPDCESWETKLAMSAPAIHIPLDGEFRGSGRSDLDRVIGRSAEVRRELYRKEQEKRNEVRKVSGQYAVGKDKDGNYLPVSETRLEKRTKAFEKFEYAKRTGVKVEQ